MQKEIIYIGDPMCSWCYGFTDVIQTIRRNYMERVKVSLVMGGFRPDGTHMVDPNYRDFLRGHWMEVSRRTGQPFDLAILNQTGWIYNTEKPCRAVVAMRHLKPEVEWEYFAAVQKGFYHKNHDPNNPESFARIAAEFGIDEDCFLHAYGAPGTIEETQRAFAWARSIGVNSFPTVVLRDQRGLAALTVGYQPLEMLEGRLDQWLSM
ncbi:MAG TPA: DsbA family protein [Noviherbaspirillum sp.]|uniref:DsbA family protein n=1 Tax=Noviherbaspirillum sp. TaxID=1926288 RepID=UPI002B46EACB|nr:DsbA family protein [Noviherbaspirillum sp.]HJV85404.1 DsbA family protein [Noviherbaspirillum sp.]